MSTLNQDLQASFHIISLLERSKANSEAIIDRLPDFFAVIDSSGNILKGNDETANRLSVDQEDILGMNISRLFTEESWRLFQIYLKQAREQSIDNPKVIEFEIPIDANRAQERICYWTISRLTGVTGRNSSLYCLIGRDITLLRAYQKQLTEIFASIPLGIFTTDRDGRIEGAFSAYTQWLLGTDQITGKTLRELLFEPGMDYLDAVGREGWNNLLNFNTLNLREFDTLSDSFPTQFFFPLPGSRGRYLGIKVQSIAHGSQVNGLLVILEDRTALVEAKKADEKERLLEDLSLERALQIKKCDLDILSVVMNDFNVLFSQLGDSIFEKDPKKLMNLLHSVKGNARLAGFTGLMKLVHGLESELREKVAENFDWKAVYGRMDEIRGEWKEIAALVKVMSESMSGPASAPDFDGSSATLRSRKSIHHLFAEFLSGISADLSPEARSLAAEISDKAKAISFKPLRNLETAIRHGAQATSAAVGKKAKVIFDWESDLLVDETHMPQIRSALMHLINNAIDHGIEFPERRLEERKSIQGLVRLDSYRAGDRLVFSVEDDGRGLNLPRILEAAIKKGLLSEKEAATLPRDKIPLLLFAPGFSSASGVTVVSGRGVGLDAVRQIAQSLNGDVEVTESKLGGASFHIFFRIFSGNN